ncbi:PIG-L deacetylase family protein [Streptomyces sp. 8L]|uniref:PIG-L deacetylase family protein n=1 Tax=Streptomyces sp. 8L TaxID=2877242 RepID=UPI0027E0D0B2|nr:PIG-L family deacetylase [Streptomyces sp. 8L]
MTDTTPDTAPDAAANTAADTDAERAPGTAADTAARDDAARTGPAPGRAPAATSAVRETATAEAGAEGTACRRAAAYAIDAEGTPESRWAAWDGLGALPVALLPPGPVLVVAAHPDDEVLGFGGMLAMLAAAETPVHLLSVTDGEASHPRSTRPAVRRLAQLRRAELKGALRELGLKRPRTTRLAIPDRAVERYEDRVRDAVAKLLRETGARLCVAPWNGDLHSDHEAAGRAAGAASAAAGVPVWCYPVWMWHWSFPGDPRVPWSSAARLPLDDGAAGAKRRAVRRFTTQTEPLGDGPEDSAILPPDELAHHMRGFEVVFR